MSERIEVGGVRGDSILIEKKASRESTRNLRGGVTRYAHKHLSSLNNWINVLLFECIIHNGGNFVAVLTEEKFTHTKN